MMKKSFKLTALSLAVCAASSLTVAAEIPRVGFVAAGQNTEKTADTTSFLSTTHGFGGENGGKASVDRDVIDIKVDLNQGNPNNDPFSWGIFGISTGSVVITGREISSTQDFNGSTTVKMDVYNVLTNHGGSVSIGSDTTEKITLTARLFGAAPDSGVNGVFGNPSELDEAVNINLTANQIKVDAQTDSMNSTGVCSGSNSHINIIGNESVLVTAKSTSKTNSQTYGVWVDNSSGMGTNGGEVNIKAPTVTIEANGKGNVRAVHVGHNLTPQTMVPETKAATLNINADTITITGKDEISETPNASGLVAMSMGEIHVKGKDTTITANNAILARGNAKVYVYAGTDYTTKLNGDINFNYDESTSKTDVNADVQVKFHGKDSVWNGSPKVTWGTGKPSKDSKLKVENLKISLNDGAVWNPDVVANNSSENESGGFGLAVNELELNDAVINLKSADQVVAAKTVKGTGANITAPVSVNGDSATVGQFVYEKAEGTPDIHVNLKGITADQLNNKVRSALAKAVMVGSVDYTAAGSDATVSSDAKAADQTQSVGEGVVAGAQTWSVVDGEVDETSLHEARNTVNDSLIDIGSANYLAFRSQINDVSARMGDLRTVSHVAGAWVRYYGGENKYSGRDMTEKYNTVQLGADGFVNENFYLGGTFSYTDGEGSLDNGSTDDKNYNFGVYGGWLGDNGQFVDVVIKRHRLETDFDMVSTNGLSTGSFDGWGTSASVEAGWRIHCPNTGFYAEPQVELMVGRVESVNYTTSQGVRVEQDGIDTVIGRAGVAVGYLLPESKGSVYFKASALHDWAGEVESTFASNGVNRTYTEDLSGTWGEFAFGGTFNPTEHLSAYGQFKTSTGSPVRNPWQVSVGVRWNF